MPKLMAALSSGNFKGILPDVMAMIEDKQLDSFRASLLEFAQRKCADGVTFSVVFEPNTEVTDIHMRIWQRSEEYGNVLKLDVPFSEVKAADLKSLITPLLQQA